MTWVLQKKNLIIKQTNKYHRTVFLVYLFVNARGKAWFLQRMDIPIARDNLQIVNKSIDQM